VGSAFVTRISNLIQQNAGDLAYAGTYHGWPVAYIDFSINEGRAHVYGGSLDLRYVRVIGPGRRLESHAAAAFAGGREWATNSGGSSLPVGGMVPVQLRFGADVDWDRWTIAPRLIGVGAQRLLATTTAADGALVRRTLSPYVTLDVNVRRSLSKRISAFATIENALDKRHRSINVRAYTNPEELLGVPQNPRRLALGLDIRLP
jgi:outer membrane receptor protein involved in Fe transport